MAQLPVHAMQLIEMRRFGDRRPLGNWVVITDDRNVAKACRAQLGIFALVVEPFLPYNLGCCYDLDVFVIMNGAIEHVLRGLKRIGPRSLTVDRAGGVFWNWIDWLIESRAGRTRLGAVRWWEQRHAAGAPRPRAP